jgi:hypothetical protein
MNQERDDTKPTWKIGAEIHISIGRIMRFDPGDPTEETGVSDGLHRLRLFTSFGRRVDWAIPYFEVDWSVPVARRGNTAFETDTNVFGGTRLGASHLASTRFGLDGVLWERAERGYRVTAGAHATLRAHFEGRAYSEMWEVFRAGGDATGAGPLLIDQNPTADGVQPRSHPGITNIENYLDIGGGIGVNALFAEHLRISAAFGFERSLAHLITFADAGIDLPTCAAAANPSCEVSSNTVVNAGSAEVNPYHVPVIDVAGRRYRITDALSSVFTLEARLLF